MVASSGTSDHWCGYAFALSHGFGTLVAPEADLLICSADLLIEGLGQMVAYRRNPSVFVGCPSFKMLALRIDLADLHRFWFKP